MNMAVLERDYRIDGIKWLLIVLVTFGHVIEPALSNPIANKLYSIIYIFHMPLFVFISGYYANVKDKEKLISKGFMLLETFLVVMIPQCFYYGSIIPLLNPENSGWYLISLITWYIIFLLIINKLVGKIVVQYNGCGGQLLIFSCLLAVFAYMLPLKQFGNLLSFQRSCMFLPFFMMGFLRRVKGLPIIPDVSKCIKLVLAIASLVCFAFCLIYSGRILHVLEFNNANVAHVKFVQSKYRNASCFESIGLYWINYYYIRCFNVCEPPQVDMCLWIKDFSILCNTRHVCTHIINLFAS